MLSGISTATIIKIIIIAGAAAAVALIVKTIVRSARRTVNSAEARIVKELVNTVAQKGFDFDENENQPKKISNMNKIYLPQIQRDFPAFNWGDTKRMIEKEIKDRFAQKKVFTIYETAIARYDKLGKDIVITTESAVSYKENETKKQSAVKAELSYIQYQSEESKEPSLKTLNCPNCSAPLKRNAAGELICEYCGTLVTGQRDWHITDIREK